MVYLGRFRSAEGMGDEFLDGDAYDSEVFPKVAMLSDSDNWPAIDRFMRREYGRRWIAYSREGSDSVMGGERCPGR